MTIPINKTAIPKSAIKAISDPPTTILSYGITTTPNPLQISTTGTLKIVVSKLTPPAAQCTSLVFTIAVGTSASSLTANASGIAATLISDDPNNPNWTITADGQGTFTCKPGPGQGSLGQYALTLTLDHIALNDQVGTTDLTITENLATSSSTIKVPLSKFPQNFSVDDLSANPPSIQPGGSTTLSWNGSEGDYSLNYGSNNLQNLPNIGNKVISDLEMTATFTLIVQVASGSNTVMLQKQFTVTVIQPVQPALTQFGIVGGTLPKVLVNTPLNLSWTTTNTTYCNLTLNGEIVAANLPANCNSCPVITPDTPGNANYILYLCDTNNITYIGRGFLIATYYQPYLEYFELDTTYEGNTEFVVGTVIDVFWGTYNANFCNLALNGENIAENLTPNTTDYALTVPNTPGSYVYQLTAFDPNNIAFANRTLTITAVNTPQLLQFGVAGTPPGQTAVVKTGSEFTLVWNATATTMCMIMEISTGTTIGNFGSAQGSCPVYAPGAAANLEYAIWLTGNDGKTYSNYPMIPVDVED